MNLYKAASKASTSPLLKGTSSNNMIVCHMIYLWSILYICCVKEEFVEDL